MAWRGLGVGVAGLAVCGGVCAAGTAGSAVSTAMAVRVEVSGFRSVGSFLGVRGGALINDHLLVEIGPGMRVSGVSWDLELTRADWASTFDDVSLGMLDLNELPYVSVPYGAPWFGLGGTRDRYDAAGNPVWTTRVSGSFDLTRYWVEETWETEDLSVAADRTGRVYFEFFEAYDDDDDWGHTAVDTELGVDSLVSGTVTFHLTGLGAVPAPGAWVVMGLAVAGRRRGG